MPSGGAVTNISVATTESWKDKQPASRSRTEWHRVVFFNRLAEIAGEYLHKGSQVYVEGRIQTRKWQDKEGKDRYTTEIIADQMQMLGGRRRVPARRRFAAKLSAGQRAGTGSTSAAGSPRPEPEFDDDIPF